MSGPLAGLLIQSVGSDGAHLHPLARSVAAADGIPPSCVWGGEGVCGERRAYFGRRLGGNPVDYLLIKDG